MAGAGVGQQPVGNVHHRGDERCERFAFGEEGLRAALDERKGGKTSVRIKTKKGEVIELDVGSVVVCTGFKEFDAKRVKAYGYGTLPDVITSFDGKPVRTQIELERPCVARLLVEHPVRLADRGGRQVQRAGDLLIGEPGMTEDQKLRLALVHAGA